MDFEKWYDCCCMLLNLGFDLDKNSARDLLGAINEFYVHYDEYKENLSKSSVNS